MQTFHYVLRGVRRAAAWVDALAEDVVVDYSRYYKEVYVYLKRSKVVFAVKVVGRRWYTTPKQLKEYVRGVFARGKRLARRVYAVILAPRLTGGALRMAAGLRYGAIIPMRSVRGVLSWLAFTIERLVRGRVWSRGVRLLVEKLEAIEDGCGVCRSSTILGRCGIS